MVTEILHLSCWFDRPMKYKGKRSVRDSSHDRHEENEGKDKEGICVL